MARATKQTWLDEGISILATMGAASLTIDLLTTRLSLTKGSFYHHFKSYDGFKAALLDYYEDASTLAIIRLTEENPDATPQRKLSRLLRISTSYPSGTEIAFRTWAMQDADVRVYQERIDSQRQQYVYDLFHAMHFDEEQARLMARIFYAILVGAEHLLPMLAMNEALAMFDEFRRLYNISSE